MITKQRNPTLEAESSDGSETSQQALDTMVTIEVIYLDDGLYAPVEPGGMVDVALRELGARVVEVKVVDA
ncbi:MAG: hypothetical protein GTO14_17305 [Anaerolineales bacterium]|nr:hypothetical protein [Anaerolineales bacterium]